jgi:hypothetical protein
MHVRSTYISLSPVTGHRAPVPQEGGGGGGKNLDLRKSKRLRKQQLKNSKCRNVKMSKIQKCKNFNSRKPKKNQKLQFQNSQSQIPKLETTHRLNSKFNELCTRWSVKSYEGVQVPVFAGGVNERGGNLEGDVLHILSSRGRTRLSSSATVVRVCTLTWLECTYGAAFLPLR